MHRRRLAALERDAETWRSHWEEIRKYIDPFRGRFLTQSQGTQQDNDGTKKHQSIINDKASCAADVLAAGIQGGLASPLIPWFRWTPVDKEALEVRGVRAWLGDHTQLTLDVLRMSNFYRAMHSCYKELGEFGTTACTHERDPQRVVFYRPLTIGEYYLAQDARMIPDTLYRRFSMTVEQLANEFGLERLDLWTQQQYQSQQYDIRVPVIHVIAPRASRRQGSALPNDMEYESVYFEEKRSDGGVLRVSGFKRKPFSAARWEVIGTDVYGRSPGMRALPHVKQLQAMERDKLLAIARHVNPPMTGSPSLKAQGGGTLVSGEITYLDPLMQEVFQPTLQTNPNITPAVTEIMRIEQRLDEIFYADRLLAITQVERQMTAYEVRQRLVEKLQVLGPVTEQVETELITPMVEAAWNYMIEWGMVAPAPPEVQGLELKLEYLGLLSQVQRGQDSVTIESILAFVNSIAQLQALPGDRPEILDKIDWDQTLDELVEIFGAPARMLKDDRTVAKVRELRAQAQEQARRAAQMQQMAEVAPGLARAAKDASETQGPGGGSFLDTLYAGVAK